MKFCKNCGAQMDDNAVICVNCHTEVDNSPLNTPAMTYNEPDPVSGLLIFICIAFSPIGLLISALNLNTGRKRSGTIYFICAILPAIISVVWFLIQFGAMFKNFSY
ncbi:zinc-ribbon domain-containing protein [Ruminococcus sp.]|uniref:zinc-ribbon domain-containing protein n=1 Tax=Ruminococcus sp. TaxID=41978 RepID=UPI0025E92705|nr:zinc-ribbon domain-containing protein [Ruminococcus sp.]MBQ8967377.1 zinc-ribbon domain-containing protein [Ruminococcus sp.]